MAGEAPSRVVCTAAGKFCHPFIESQKSCLINFQKLGCATMVSFNLKIIYVYDFFRHFLTTAIVVMFDSLHLRSDRSPEDGLKLTDFDSHEGDNEKTATETEGREALEGKKRIFSKQHVTTSEHTYCHILLSLNVFWWI